MSEALPTMWLTGALPPRELLARAWPWLRKKLLFEASKLWPPAIKVGIGWNHRNSVLAWYGVVSVAQEVSTP
jgi:hypothetical protein